MSALAGVGASRVLKDPPAWLHALTAAGAALPNICPEQLGEASRALRLLVSAFAASHVKLRGRQVACMPSNALAQLCWSIYQSLVKLDPDT